jgi:YegS/Rv2252/BmrU family lipid kinase
MEYLFVVNPMSGKRDAETRIIPEIERYCGERSLDCAIEVTRYPHHATEIVERYAAKGTGLRACACGGDGTLNEVATGAIGHDNVELACYACGGGNDFVKSFGSREDFNSASVVEGESVPIDILTVNDRYCVNILSIGLDADVCASIERYRHIPALRGPAAYNLALVERVMRPIGKELDIEIDGESVSGRYTMLTVGNGEFYGGGYHATPEARTNDGVIDVVLVRKMGLVEVVGLISTYKKGEHIIDGKVIAPLRDKLWYYKAGRLKIKSQKEYVVNIDGEILRAKTLNIGILRGALRFVVPRAADKRR